MLKARIVLSGCFVLALLGASWCAAIYAGKPAPPPPPPPPPPPSGTIYFQVQTTNGAQTWRMDADGKNKHQALPTGTFGNPSSLLYGANGRRWWLVSVPDGRFYDHIIHADGSVVENARFAHCELYAISVNDDFSLTWHPVCDSYGKFVFPGSQDGSFNGGGGRPDFAFLRQWSTEGRDLFVYSYGEDISQAYFVQDGIPWLDLRIKNGINPYNPNALCCVDVPPGGNYTTVGNSVEAGEVLGPESLTIVPGEWPTSNTENIHFSPDGLSVLCEVGVYHPERNGWILELHLRDAFTGNTLWASTAYDPWQGSRWSPLGGKIAFSQGSGGIWSMAADRSGYNAAVKIHAAPNKPFSRATDPRWSPDASASYLAYFERLGGNSPTQHIYRMKSDGSGVVNLTADLDAGTDKWPYRWVSNDPATTP